MKPNKVKFRDPRNDLTDVWSPTGEKHTLSLTNAREMVRHHGWSRTNPAPAAPEAPDDNGEKKDGAPAPTPASEMEDISIVGKDVLRKAAKVLGIEIDARSADKRISAQIETELDKRLTETGDVNGAEHPNEGDPADVVARKLAASIARRHRAFVCAATNAVAPIEADAKDSQIIAAIAAKATE